MGLDIKTLAATKRIITNTKTDLTAESITSVLGYTPVDSNEINSTLELGILNHNASGSSHTDIRNLILGLATRLNALVDSDDATLDQLSEIVAYIKNNKSLIDSVTTNKINISDIIDNLTSSDINKPLSAKQGKVLKDLITGLITTIDNKVDKVDGKGLSANDYTTAEKNKLNEIATGAEVNVQSDWNVTDTNSDAFIKNKPTIPTVGNGTVTIKQAGVNKGSFTMNQTGNTVIDLTDDSETITVYKSETANFYGLNTVGSPKNTFIQLKMNYHCMRFSNGIQILSIAAGEYLSGYPITLPYAFINNLYECIISNDGQDGEAEVPVNQMQLTSKESSFLKINLNDYFVRNPYAELPQRINVLLIGRWK